MYANRGGGNNSYVYWGTSTGFSTTSRTDLPTVSAVDVKAADIDADGHVDLAFANGSGTSSYVYWGSATGFTTTARDSLPTTNPGDVELGDIDSDGHTDIVFSNYTKSPYVYWGSATGFHITSVTGLSTAGYATDTSLYDINGDGYLDVAVSRDVLGPSSAGYYSSSKIFWGTSSGVSLTGVTDIPSVEARAIKIVGK